MEKRLRLSKALAIALEAMDQRATHLEEEAADDEEGENTAELNALNAAYAILKAHMEENNGRMHYHYGQNIPGYLPMADEPNMSETWEGARDALVDEIERAGDMADVDDYAPGWGDSWEQALEDVRTWETGEEIYVNVASDGPHDLGVSYWVTACTENECWETLEDDR